MKDSLVAAFLAGCAAIALAIGIAVFVSEPPAVPHSGQLFNLATALATTACAWQLTTRR